MQARLEDGIVVFEGAGRRPANDLEIGLFERIAELEGQLRVWRDDYARSADGLTVAVPVYQITRLVDEKPEAK